MNSECTPRVRSLFAWEVQEARRVFGSALRYEVIRIHECVKWPNTLNQIASKLRRKPLTGIDNAVTLGKHCYFPVRLLEELVSHDHPEFNKILWVIHELTHVWQYQQIGWGYLFKALAVQIRLGMQAYDYGGEQGLVSGHQQGLRLDNFNLEQQGDIARDYYRRLARGQDLSAWEPYIVELQQVNG